MKKLEGYMAGANLGHWLSQYGGKSDEHWSTYITEPDIARMRGWGLDHVRVPVDYFMFERDEEPGVYDEKRLAYIDRTLEWCRKNGMNMILDLHHAPGFFFGNGAKNDLFTSEASRKRYLDIWRMFAERYSSEGDSLIFELLNELVWENSDPWNVLWQETAAEIHKISPARRIIVGGNFWNSVNELRNLALTDDERIIYTFHFYEPFIFTHQRAGWMPNMVAYKKPVAYPFVVSEHADFWGDAGIPAQLKGLETADRRALGNYLRPALDFAEKTKKTLYCGEYGVIANADDASAARWLDDIGGLLSENGIGRAVWSYRGFSAITSPDDKTWNEDMVRAISRV